MNNKTRTCQRCNREQPVGLFKHRSFVCQSCKQIGKNKYLIRNGELHPDNLYRR